MNGLDDRIAALADGGSGWIVLAVAVLFGLRHAADPDHLAAVASLVASSNERAARTAGVLGFAWGAGHATSLCLFGVPIVLVGGYLPECIQQGAETAVGLIIAYLGMRLVLRWRRGTLRYHPHPRTHHVRTRAGAFAIGLAHGMGGSAGVGVLLLASIPSRMAAIGALVVLAVFTAVSMSVLSSAFGLVLVTRPAQAAFGTLAPCIGAANLAFGLWYATAAWSLAPYPA